MGLQAIGVMVKERIFFKAPPHFKSIEAYESMASIDTRSMNGRIDVVGDHKVIKMAKIRNRHNRAPQLHN